MYESLLVEELTCREKARNAGIGTRAAMKKAIMLLTDVRATLVPLRRRHSPVRSWVRNVKMSNTNSEWMDNKA